MQSFQKQSFFYLLTLVVLVGGFIFWQSDLTSDPPMHYSGMGQSLSTDPAQYIFHARNKALFGQFDPYDYPRWTVYQHSLTSLVGYIWFSIARVSLKQANMVGVILSIGGLLFLILGLARHHRPWVTTAIALCFVLNVTLLTYGRLSYLENGLIFLAALVFFVYSWWGDRIWGMALAGGLVAVVMLAGKLFGALLLPALVLSALFSGHARRWTHVVTVIAAFLLVGLGMIVLLYGRDVQAAFTYVGEQSFGLRGFPEGLSSPWGFFEHLISYGLKNRLFYVDADLLLFLFVGVFLLSLHLSEGNKISALSPATVFSMFWLLVAVVGLMPLNYSPLRYALLVIPPAILFCLTMFENRLDVKKTSTSRLGKVETTLLVFAFWYVLFHAIVNIFFFNTMPHPIRIVTWTTLPGSIGLAYLIRFLLARGYLRVSRRKLVIVLLTVLCISVVFNGYKIRRIHFLEHNFNIVEANRDVEAILAPGAVVSGPYGPVLTVDTPLKSFIHLFGVAEVDSALFDRQPVTHVATDMSNWTEAIKNYPILKSLLPITTYWIRDVEVRLFNISDVFNNPQARSYEKTLYERAMAYYQAQQYDSALSAADRFYESHPRSKSAGLLLGDLLAKKGRLNEAFSLLTSLTQKFPTDFNIHLYCGKFIQVLAEQKNDNSLRYMAETYYAKAVKINPFKADYARKTWQQIGAQFRKGTGPTQP
jgi:hypothetical protein